MHGLLHINGASLAGFSQMKLGLETPLPSAAYTHVGYTHSSLKSNKSWIIQIFYFDSNESFQHYHSPCYRNRFGSNLNLIMAFCFRSKLSKYLHGILKVALKNLGKIQKSHRTKIYYIGWKNLNQNPFTSLSVLSVSDKNCQSISPKC